MKLAYSLVLAFISAVTPVLAQSDTLSSGDTISVVRQRLVFSTLRFYNYHQATQLVAEQVVPLLRRSPETDAVSLARRFKQQQTLAGVLTFVGLGSMTGGLLLSARRPEPSLALMLGGLGSVYIAPVLRSEGLLERAVNAHNHRLRSQSGDYYRPLFAIHRKDERLTLADTVRVKRSGLKYRFAYRGVWVDPATNLLPAFEQLRSGRITSNLRYVRTVRTVTRIVSGLAAGTLTSYLLLYAARRTTGPYPLNKGLVYTSSGVMGLGIVANWHTNHVQAGTMSVYNEKLREKMEQRERE